MPAYRLIAYLSVTQGRGIREEERGRKKKCYLKSNYENYEIGNTTENPEIRYTGCRDPVYTHVRERIVSTSQIRFVNNINLIEN